MSTREARMEAAKLGLSAWQAEMAVVGAEPNGTMVTKCIGFVGIGMALAEAESWEEALSRALQIIYKA
jgi:hypothetical protein